MGKVDMTWSLFKMQKNRETDKFNTLNTCLEM